MKKLLLILFYLPLLTLAQQTYVHDDNFEQYLIIEGYDNVLDDYVVTANIDTITQLLPAWSSIADLTGIEDFTSLTYLNCAGNFLTNLDISNNTSLIALYCYDNQITSLDVSVHTQLSDLFCFNNQLSTLDVSNNSFLVDFHCGDNILTSLDLRNGNNQNIVDISMNNNSSLTCINVDNDIWSSNNWTITMGIIDAQHYFSTNCSSTFVEEFNANKRTLGMITDMLGQETPYRRNTFLFYMYDDGTVEKKIIIE